VYQGYTHDDGTPGDSVLQHLGKNGLINFTDYLFLLTVLGSKYLQPSFEAICHSDLMDIFGFLS
jgi:hypothetical protein